MENKDKQILKAGSFYYSDGTFSNELDKSKTFIGICVIPPNFLPDGKARIMSLKEMDYNNPEKGSLQHVGMCWGQYGIAFDDIHGYYWSSSEYDIEIAFFMDARSACFEYVSKDYDDPFVRAFLMV